LSYIVLCLLKWLLHVTILRPTEEDKEEDGPRSQSMELLEEVVADGMGNLHGYLLAQIAWMFTSQLGAALTFWAANTSCTRGNPQAVIVCTVAVVGYNLSVRIAAWCNQSLDFKEQTRHHHWVPRGFFKAVIGWMCGYYGATSLEYFFRCFCVKYATSIDSMEILKEKDFMRWGLHFTQWSQVWKFPGMGITYVGTFWQAFFTTIICLVFVTKLITQKKKFESHYALLHLFTDSSVTAEQRMLHNLRRNARNQRQGVKWSVMAASIAASIMSEEWILSIIVIVTVKNNLTDWGRFGLHVGIAVGALLLSQLIVWSSKTIRQITWVLPSLPSLPSLMNLSARPSGAATECDDLEVTAKATSAPGPGLAPRVCC